MTSKCKYLSLAAMLSLGAYGLSSGQESEGGCSTTWLLAAPAGNGPDGAVSALIAHDDGSGRALYAGGAFQAIGGIQAQSIARWDGVAWSSVGDGQFHAPVTALATFDAGSGPELFAGVNLIGVSSSDQTPVVLRWDGFQWSGTGMGLHDVSNLGPGDAWVRDLAVHDDGQGPALYAGGSFPWWEPTMGAYDRAGLARWTGASWEPIGLYHSVVRSLESFDDGTGPALFIDGRWRFQGGGFSSFGGGLWTSSGAASYADAQTVFDDGRGEALYAGGNFAQAGGQPIRGVARWDGNTWSALGHGMGGGSSASVQSLAVFNDGSGPALYAGGTFTVMGGMEATRIARWDGQTWTSLGGGVGVGPESAAVGVHALLEFESGAGGVLWAAGSFAESPSGGPMLARWGCPGVSQIAGCIGNQVTLHSPWPNAPLGYALPVRIEGGAVQFGLASLYLGFQGSDLGGCGLWLEGLGELLLSPAPHPQILQVTLVVSGEGQFDLFLPVEPALIGVSAHLQAAVLSGALAFSGLSTALKVDLGS